MGRTTIRDVAAAAGVSAMTVSNVINGHRHAVSDRTAQVVAREIQRLNYRIVSAGRNLRLGRRHLIGVILVDEAPDFLANPFMSKVLAGLSNLLNAHDHAMVVQGIHPREFARAVLLRKTETDAFCVKLAGDVSARRRMLTELAKLTEPVALVQETLAPRGVDSCSVRQDDFGGGVVLADHLAARGVGRVAVLTPSNAGGMTEARVQGLRAGLRAAGRRVAIEVVPVEENSFESAFATTRRFIVREGLPDAFFCCSDELATGAIRGVQDLNYAVPDDVLVSGFNGFAAAHVSNPSLTTVCSRPKEIGEIAGSELLSRLGGGSFSEHEVVLPVHLRPGQSTNGRRAGQDGRGQTSGHRQSSPVVT